MHSVGTVNSERIIDSHAGFRKQKLSGYYQHSQVVINTDLVPVSTCYLSCVPVYTLEGCFDYKLGKVKNSRDNA